MEDRGSQHDGLFNTPNYGLDFIGLHFLKEWDNFHWIVSVVDGRIQ
jgi:hypothetical protein